MQQRVCIHIDVTFSVIVREHVLDEHLADRYLIDKKIIRITNSIDEAKGIRSTGIIHQTIEQMRTKKTPT